VAERFRQGRLLRRPPEPPPAHQFVVAFHHFLSSWCGSTISPTYTPTGRTFALTRSGAGVDLPGFGCVRINMSDQAAAQADRVALCGCARRTVQRDDDRGYRPWRTSDFPYDDAEFEGYSVKTQLP